jgi:cob(I)alamin adenosyltransferase
LENQKIYTRTGDTGDTGLFGGGRISKDNLRIECYGTIDELNASIGIVTSSLKDQDLHNCLTKIQSTLFDIGGELATPNIEKRKLEKKYVGPQVADMDIKNVEKLIDQFDEEIEPLKAFILPGGHLHAAQIHLSRTICRRAERLLVELNKTEKISSEIIRYINRLSDLLFTIARVINKRYEIEEPQWKGKTEKNNA